ncbi:unnamed protein product, partial [Iphiclides podalirius]
MSNYEDRLKSTLNGVAGKLGLQSYRLRYRDVDETIENYFGVLIPVTLVGESDDIPVCRDLIVKMPPDKQELRDAGVLEYLYDVEIFFYTTIIPHYKNLSKKNLSELFPECYYSDTSKFNEVIVLKDMCEDGYRRHHGNRRGSVDPNFLLKPYSSVYPHELMVALRGSLKNHVDKFKDTKRGKLFTTVAANFDEIVNDSVCKAKRLVYGHGDFWKENILYKYEGNKPIKACVLDFQTIRLLCPAQDVVSFLFTSTEAENRRLEKDALLKSKHICGEERDNNASIDYYKRTILEIVDDFVTFGYFKS